MIRFPTVTLVVDELATLGSMNPSTFPFDISSVQALVRGAWEPTTDEIATLAVALDLLDETLDGFDREGLYTKDARFRDLSPRGLRDAIPCVQRSARVTASVGRKLTMLVAQLAPIAAPVQWSPIQDTDVRVLVTSFMVGGAEVLPTTALLQAIAATSVPLYIPTLAPGGSVVVRLLSPVSVEVELSALGNERRR